MKKYNYNEKGKSPLTVFLCCVFSMLLLAACSKDHNQLKGKYRWVETFNTVSPDFNVPE